MGSIVKKVPRGLSNSKPAETKRTWNGDPQPILYPERAAGSERKSGGFVRWTGRQQKRLNALIPREAKIPEGSGDRQRGRLNRVVEVQRARGSEAAATGANRGCGSGAEGPNGHGSDLEGSEVAG